MLVADGSAISTARSTACASSRTFPGQACARSTVSAASSKPRERLAIPGRVVRQEMRGERGDVVAPIAQRRQVNDDGVQPVEQVLAEAAGGDLRSRSALVAERIAALT